MEFEGGKGISKKLIVEEYNNCRSGNKSKLDSKWGIGQNVRRLTTVWCGINS